MAFVIGEIVYFVINYTARGHCTALASYWQFAGLDKTKMAQAYFTVAKDIEDCKSSKSHAFEIMEDCK